MQVLTHQGRWRKVTAAGAKLGETVVLKGNHYGLECTLNHPIYSTGERKYYPQLGDGKRGNQTILTDEKKWIPAGEMKGHLWGVPNHADALPITSPVYSSQKEKKCPPLSEKLFYFVGRWLGDGWVRNGQRSNRPDGETYGNIFLCDSYDKEEELRKTVESVSKRYNVSHMKTCVRIRFCSRVFAEWLTDNFGHYASEKTLPAWVFGMQESWRAALLKGLLDSDGYKMKNCECEYRITTVSKKLAESIRLLGEMQGYSTTIFFVKTPDTAVIEGRTVNQKDYYTVELAKGKKRRHLSDNLHGWYRVRSVTPTHEVKPVYNLTVEEDNSYIADGIVVHNCQDLSIAGKREGIKGARSGLFYQAVRIIKEMRDQEHFHQTTERTSDVSSKTSAESKTRTYQFLNLSNGTTQDLSWEMVTPLHGESLTLNTGESPREENGSTLSQILMAGVPERYCLSPKACRGILARVEKRGKKLPEILEKALRRQAGV